MKQKLLLFLALFVAITVSAEVKTLSVGGYNSGKDSPKFEGTNWYNAPIIPTYSHSGIQLIYTADELKEMANSHIISLKFKLYVETFEEYNSSIKVYLQETDQTAFEFDEASERYRWMTFASNSPATISYSLTGLDYYTEDAEMELDLSAAPFSFSGKNLVVTIINDSGSMLDASNGYIAFYSYDVSSVRNASFCSDEKDFPTNQEKDDLVKYADNEFTYKQLPVVQFGYEPSGTTPEQSFSGGEGTEVAPYLISSINDLNTLDEWTNTNKTEGMYFKLTKDITEEAFTGMIGTKGNFKGSFDGDNHCVKVDINLPDSNYVGLFCCIEEGTLKNLQVEGNVIGNSYVGGVVGNPSGATIENVVNYCNVTGSSFVGGVLGAIVSMTVPCVVSQCANYGIVSGESSGVGGVIGYSGQRVGNSIQRIANYGHVVGSIRTAGLVGNPLFDDAIKYGINFGTGETNKVSGCLGNSNAQTIEGLYYDCQYMNSESQYANQMKKTSELTGNGIKNDDAENGLSEQYWLFADNMFPRLKINGQENSSRAILFATPVLLAEGNTLDNISEAFNVVTDNGVVWSSKNGKTSISDGKATLLGTGEDVLVATLDGYSRELKINITGMPVGVAENEASDNVITGGNGIISLKLASDATVWVFNMAGQTVMKGIYPAGNQTLPLAKGFYIVDVNGKAYKVSVR